MTPEGFPILTPMQVEQQLRGLSRQIGEAQQENAELEMSYSTLKAELEIGRAEVRLRYADMLKPSGKGFTVDERDDHATVENMLLIKAVAVEEAKVKASRGRINQLNTQADIARSVSTSVRTSMTLEG